MGVYSFINILDIQIPMLVMYKEVGDKGRSDKVVFQGFSERHFVLSLPTSSGSGSGSGATAGGGRSCCREPSHSNSSNKS